MNPSTSKHREVAARSSKRRWGFRILALSIPVLFFVLLELGLRFAGTGYPTSFFVAHPSKPGYVVDNYKFAWRFFPKPLARTPQPLVVEQTKPQDTFRIIVFGGSAAMGDPEPAFGMPRVLEVLLQRQFPKKRIEVINAAVTAINSHVVRDIARDCRFLDADAWIVYMGNNEVHGPFGAGTVFGGKHQSLWLSRLALRLQTTKTGQAMAGLLTGRGGSSVPTTWGGMQMFLDQTLRYDNPELERVYDNFATNLKAIIATCPAKTNLLVSTVVTNTKDFPPLASLHGNWIRETEKQEWQATFQRGCEAQLAGAFHEALDAFALAERIDPEHAELHFRQSQCLRAVGQQELADAECAKARDYDCLRFRADTRINDIVRKISGESERVVFVDAEQKLAELAGGSLGDELLYEHVHLTFAGNYKLASLIAKELSATNKQLASENSTLGPWLTQQQCQAALGHTPFHERITLQDVRGRLNAAPFVSQMDAPARDMRIQQQLSDLAKEMTPQLGEQVISQYKDRISARADDCHARNQFAAILNSIGDLEGAAEQFQVVADTFPHDPASQFRLGSQYNRMKQREKAESFLRRAIELRPDFARAFNSLAICLSHQGRMDECYANFSKAVELQPSFDEAYVNWAMVLASQGDGEGAVQKFRVAVQANANNVAAHVKLGQHLASAKNFQDARVHYEAVARLRPQDAAAQLNLGMLYLQLDGEQENAKQRFLRALELNPGNAIAEQHLDALENSAAPIGYKE